MGPVLTRDTQIEGAFTVLVGVVFISIFPRSPANPVSLLGYRYFSEREAQILHQRVILDDPTKLQPRPNVSRAEVKAAVSYPFLHRYTLTWTERD